MFGPLPVQSATDQSEATVIKDRYEATYVVSNDSDPSKSDFGNLQDAINALPASGGKIFVKAGTYILNDTISIATSNVHIQGEGMGLTILRAGSSVTGDTPALEAFNKGFGTPRNLTAGTKRGDTTIQLAPGDAASFHEGDYVLIFSKKKVDYQSDTKHAGEVKRVTPFDASTGIVNLDDQVFDEYTLADSAQVVRVSMLQDITISDLSVTTQATQSDLSMGFTHFRFIDNLQIERVEVHDAFFSGIQLESVLNAGISGCYVHHIRNVPRNNRYGLWIGGASQNVSVSGCRFSHTRHGITTGGISGLFHDGVQRNIVVTNCTSMLSDTCHFDTHEPVENIVFTGCVAIGGVSQDSDFEAYGFQMRGHNCSIIGCSVLQTAGEGIHLFGPRSSGAVIVGNMIANVRAINGKSGIGIFMDNIEPGQVTATSAHTITGNVIKNCDGPAIANGGSNTDLVISNNVIMKVNLLAPGPAIKLKGAPRALIMGNNISGSSSNAVQADCDAVILNNTGYNPVGNIVNPWPADGDLTNEITGASSANPASGKTYTVRQSPKTIVIAGAAGVVSDISINGAVTGLNRGVFKLDVNETIAVTYAGSLTTTVHAV